MGYYLNFYVRLMGYYQLVHRHVYSLILRFWHPRAPMDVYRVLKYMSGTAEYTDLTRQYLQGERMGLSDAEYLEFRVLWKGSIYRYLVGQQDSYPKYDEFLSPTLQESAHTPRIVNAVLMKVGDISTRQDVLNRVLKFAGPKHDFFKKMVCVHQVFINDDLDDTFQLILLRSNGKINTYSTQDYINHQ